MRNSFNLVFVGLKLFTFFASNRFDSVWEHGGHSRDFNGKFAGNNFEKGAQIWVSVCK